MVDLIAVPSARTGSFLLHGQKKATKEKAARSRRSAARSPLRFSPGRALANSLRSDRARLIPGPAAMLGAAYGTRGATPNRAANFSGSHNQCAISNVSEKSLISILRFLPTVEMMGRKTFRNVRVVTILSWAPVGAAEHRSHFGEKRAVV